MVVIVASILLELGIDAWWQTGQERKATAGFRELLRVQMTADAEMLEEEAEEASEAQSSLGAAVRAISPSPGAMTADSLWSLIPGGWGMSDQNPEVSALERVPGLETFNPTERPALYRQRIMFRGLPP